MDEANPYSAPEAELREAGTDDLRLGGRIERLAAAFIDGFILMLLLLPAMYFGGYFAGIMAGQQPGYGAQALWSAISFGIFLALQGYPLAATGQTWGKKLLRLKIVDLQGRKPDFGRLVVLRYLSSQLIALLPYIGTLYLFVDCLFIFRDDRRCLHDHIAGTRVVVAD